MLEEITRAPKAFQEAFSRVNACIRAVRAITAMEGRGGIKITKSENNWIIESTGSGVPDGYEEYDAIICNDGTPESGRILFKPDA